MAPTDDSQLQTRGDSGMPETITPMLVGNPEYIPEEPGWASEIKWDGVRAIAFCEDGVLRLQGARQDDITDLFPEIESLGRVENAQGTILDGELVSFGERGIPSLRNIQQRLDPERAESGPETFRSYLATFIIFDLLWMDGEDLRELPYRERRRRLESLNLDGITWNTPDYIVAEVNPTLEATTIQGLEGLVLKRLDSPYVSGRHDNPFWKKLASHPRQEFVIGGWIPAKGRDEPGALLIGYWGKLPGDGEYLKFAGVVSRGLVEDDISSIETDVARFATDSSPFREAPHVAEARFVNPIRVVEVSFQGWEEGGTVRDPIYVGMRRDRDPGDVRREPPGPVA